MLWGQAFVVLVVLLPKYLWMCVLPGVPTMEAETNEKREGGVR